MGQKVQGSSFSSTARDAPELAALQGLVAASSGVCCVATASSHTLELAALQHQASHSKESKVTRSKATRSKATSSKAMRSKATRSKQASKRRRLLTFSCARGSRSNSSNSAPAPAAPAPQPQLQLPLHSRPRSLEL